MRPLSNKNPRDLREETGQGLQWCNHNIQFSKILDEIENSLSLDELKNAVSKAVSKLSNVS